MREGGSFGPDPGHAEAVSQAVGRLDLDRQLAQARDPLSEDLLDPRHDPVDPRVMLSLASFPPVSVLVLVMVVVVEVVVGFGRVVRRGRRGELDVDRADDLAAVLRPEPRRGVARQSLDLSQTGEGLPDLVLPLLAQVQRQHLGRVLDEGHDRGEDEDGDEDGRERVEARPAVPVDEQRRDDHADRAERVGHDVEEDALHVVRVVVPAVVVVAVVVTGALRVRPAVAVTVIMDMGGAVRVPVRVRMVVRRMGVLVRRGEVSVFGMRMRVAMVEMRVVIRSVR